MKKSNKVIIFFFILSQLLDSISATSQIKDAKEISQSASLASKSVDGDFFLEKQSHNSAFEENKGQITGTDASKVTYTYKSGNLSVFLLKTGIAYQFNKTTYPAGHKYLKKVEAPADRKKEEQLREKVQTETFRMDLILLDANPNATIISEEKNSDYVNYYNHNTLNVHSFKKITYKSIYPKIDWIIYTSGEHVKYDFVVWPGGNPNDIRLQTRNVESEKLNNDGSLQLKSRMGDILEKAPICFQDGKELKTKFTFNDDYYSFDIAGYDRSKMLVIDPYVEWATYYGGNGDESGYSCAVSNFDIYVTGYASSANNIASGGYQDTIGGGIEDAFLVKFSSTGARLWATYYGGNDWDQAQSCGVDSMGNVYMAGYTRSTSNIAYAGFQNGWGGGYDGFLVKFNSAGTRQWATYYGGAGDEHGSACAVDKSGSVYLTGETNSTGLANNGFQNSLGGNVDAYMVKFNSAGVRQWATYYGSSGWDYGKSCVLDNSGFIYLAGDTDSTNNIATSGASQTVFAGQIDAFLVKFDTNGVRQWATYYGGPNFEQTFGCSVDGMDNVYIMGNTNSTSGIAFAGFQNINGGFYDCFFAKFNSSGVKQWSSYYGGTDYDVAFSCVANTSGSLYLTGWTDSDTGIASNGYQNTNAVGADAFLVKFNNAGMRQWGTYYGGENYDDGFGCAIDNTGAIYVAGSTGSLTNVANGGFQNIQGGGYASDAMLVKFIDTCTQININLQPVSQSVCNGDSAKFIVNSANGNQFQWQVNIGSGYVNITNGSNYSGVNNDTLIIYTNSSLNGWSYRCIVSSSNSCGQIMSNTVILTVNQNLTPTFSLPNAVCFGAPVPILPTVSSNSISGIWSPNTISNTASGAYIFTPTPVSGQCFNNYALNITITSSIIPTFNVDTSICNGSAVAVLASISLNGITGAWTPSVIDNANSGNYIFTPSGGQCAIPHSLSISVHNISNSVDTRTICANEVPYSWNGIANAATGSIFNTSTIYGCDSIVTLQLNVLPPAATVTFDTAACGTIYYNGRNYTENTTVLDTTTNSFGCDSIIHIAHLIIYPNNPIAKVIDTLGCDQVIFEGNTYTENKTIIDTYQNELGCDSLQRTVNIIVDHFELNLTLTPEDPYVGEKITLASSANTDDYTIISWLPVSRFPDQGKFNYSMIANQDGTVTIKGRDKYGCADTATINYYVKSLDYGIFVPNAFTPNGDGNNDVFMPRFYMKRAYMIKSFYVFDRWGKMVYSKFNTMNGSWDGTYNNHQPADLGNYAYSMIIEFLDGKIVPIKGDVTLLR